MKPIQPPTAWIAPARRDTSAMPLLDLAVLPDTVLMRALGRALTLRRNFGGETEAGFVAWLGNRLPVTMIDAAGNLHVDMRTGPQNRTMFTAHTDTAHSDGGPNSVHVDGVFWRAGVGAALGADDGAGVALLCHMIDAGMPGYYLFCRGEERGGVGSKWIAAEMHGLFKDIDRAVAFDREGCHDVITHQAGRRCASDEFAWALADQLGAGDHWFMPDTTGVYTDTAEFTHLVPECTNISVGYKNQHGDNEEQDIAFLNFLATRVLEVKWDELPVLRTPAAHSRNAQNSHISRNMSRLMRFGFNSDDDCGKEAKAPALPLCGKGKSEPSELMDALGDAQDGDFLDLMDLIAMNELPLDPVLALCLMDKRRLTEKHLTTAVKDLLEGRPSTGILNALYDVACHGHP